MSTGLGEEAVTRAQVDAAEQALVAPQDASVTTLVRAPAREQWSALRACLATLAPFVLADVISLAACGLIARIAMDALLPGDIAWSAALAMLALLPLLAGYWLTGIYSEIWIHPAVEFRQLTHVNTIALLAAAVPGVLVAPQLAPWAAAAWISTIVIVPLARNVARACCVNRKWWGFPTAVIAAGESSEEAVRLILDCPRSGLRPVVLMDPHGDRRSSSVRVVNDLATLESLIRRLGVRHAVISLPDYSAGRLAAALDRYSNLVPHLLVLSDTSTLPTLWGASRSGGRLSGMEVRNGLMMATLQSLKRLADVIAAAAILVIALPVFVVIAAMIKLCTPGPVFYGHVRIGRHGRSFKAWKFRTMHVNADEILRQYLDRVVAARDEWDRDQKLRQDPRVTRLGAFLRRTSIDELPQIWNVLRGEMSIVGPRPIVSAEVERYADVFHLYTRLKPGITGLWQVSGRNDVGYEDRVRLDQFYIRHWSPWLDVYILAKTVVALLKREGAY